mmetsp:Transcript_15665/g.25989  ORF Transcript_15665/g.25989 Transcript_15665/m.25989 type:complete len:204 (+) Transcript_15665:129-740(+)
MPEEGAGVTIASVKDLVRRREEIEEEIETLTESLRSGPGLSGNLIDKDGFPRSDLDIPSVRSSRNRLACLHTDHKQITKQIEQDLLKLHAQTRSSGTTSSQPAVISKPSLPPFALIDEVSSDSPATAAGLCVGDAIVSFGPLTRKSIIESGSNPLQVVARVVGDFVGKAMPVSVERNGAIVNLELTPKQWSGRGLLGCHIVPK